MSIAPSGAAKIGAVNFLPKSSKEQSGSAFGQSVSILTQICCHFS